MTGKEIAMAIILGIVAMGCTLIGIWQLCQKGPVLNNSYLHATKKEREEMDKSPYYFQSGIVFLLLGLAFVFDTLTLFVAEHIFFNLFWATLLIAIAFAVVSSINTGKKE